MAVILIFMVCSCLRCIRIRIFSDARQATNWLIEIVAASANRPQGQQHDTHEHQESQMFFGSRSLLKKKNSLMC